MDKHTYLNYLVVGEIRMEIFPTSTYNAKGGAYVHFNDQYLSLLHFSLHV